MMQIHQLLFRAAYLGMSHRELWDRVSCAEGILKECTLCPRNCGVDRTSGEVGFCKTGNKPFVSSWGPHFGEEKPLVGRFGSGTIFFGHCNLGCVFCQNWTISHLGEGEEISFARLAKIMGDLEGMGCHNINLVTPTHQMPMILHSLAIAVEKGLTIPIVYNCGGYESLEALKLLRGIVDIYMPDFKYADSEMTLKYSKVKDYPERAKASLKEMHMQVGDLVMDGRGIARRGLLVRHLVLPEDIAGTEQVVSFIAGEISENTYLNIMDQYSPCYKASEQPLLNRKITKEEYGSAVRKAQHKGIKRIDGVTG
ncbi:MAG TPA: radical SAM protein [Thermodesulfovibrionales bacterium]|nr:radical SAM protein [Thermodesulfovibrionales bacterium]